MSNHQRKMRRIRDAHLLKSWHAWLETIKEFPLGQRLTIAYQIVPRLRIAAQLSMLLVAIVVILVAVIVGAIEWPGLEVGGWFE
jgi:hypothetical protein